MVKYSETNDSPPNKSIKASGNRESRVCPSLTIGATEEKVGGIVSPLLCLNQWNPRVYI